MEITNTSAYPMDFEAEDIVERFARAIKPVPETATAWDWRS